MQRKQSAYNIKAVNLYCILLWSIKIILPMNNEICNWQLKLMNDQNLFYVLGPILWKILASSGRAVSVYNSGKGFIIKIHDQLGFKFRCSHYNGKFIRIKYVTYFLICTIKIYCCLLEILLKRRFFLEGSLTVGIIKNIIEMQGLPGKPKPMLVTNGI